LATTGLRRKNGLKRLKNLCSFKHNLDVLKKGVGQILVVRRSKENHPADTYLPCSHCYGFFISLSCGIMSVRTKSEAKKTRNAIDNSCSLLEGALGTDGFVDEHLRQQIMSHRRKDKVLTTVMSDSPS